MARLPEATGRDSHSSASLAGKPSRITQLTNPRTKSYVLAVSGVSMTTRVSRMPTWSSVSSTGKKVGHHDPGRRAEGKGTAEQNVYTEWATEACQDPRRWVRSSGSRSGLTVKVTGWSPSAGFLVTVVLALKDHPPKERWWGLRLGKRSRWKSGSTRKGERHE